MPVILASLIAALLSASGPQAAPPPPLDVGRGALTLRQAQGHPEQGRGVSAIERAKEVVAEVRVHGNLVTPDEEVLELAGVMVGMSVGPRTAEDATTRLRLTRRFKQVEVLTRFASISDPTKIVLVIIVDEGPVRIRMTGDPDRPTRAVRVRGLNLFFMPELGVDDNYGFTYGGRLAMADVAGPDSRLSFPLTWGGIKQAGIDLDKDFDEGPVSSLGVGVSILRREHPFFEQDEDRVRLLGKVERQVTLVIRAGATGSWQRVSFLGAEDRFVSGGASLVFDTRRDAMLARNAVYARAAWEHVAFQGGSSVALPRSSDRPDGGVNRIELEGRGYIGLVGQNVLVLRALRQDADKTLPDYLKPMLGGLNNLRGFKPGSSIGDTLVAGSIEVRMPLTSPLSFGKLGINVFVDAGTAYNKDRRFKDQTVEQGYGAGVWFSAAIFQFNLAVAHGSGGSTRVHAIGGATF